MGRTNCLVFVAALGSLALTACNVGTIGEPEDPGAGGQSGAGQSAGSAGGPAGSGGSSIGTSGAGGGSMCGDGSCTSGESCESCAEDCGECAPTCGNQMCDAAETCMSCPADCGACPAMCGNQVCEAGENCMNCQADCGACPPTCGNQACEAGENCMNCSGDCGACPPMCGNQVCEAGETCMSCVGDCGMCPAMCAGAGPATTALDAEEQAFLGLINQYRAQNGLGSLSNCTSLSRAAQGHSEDMRDQNYFSHTGLNGSSPWDRSCDACYELGCGLKTQMAENIAAGNSTAQETFNQWKNSAGHNANMLGGAFVVIGIGRATGGGQYGVYWTTVFGAESEASCN
jgi:uncharacterized protein YkwD